MSVYIQEFWRFQMRICGEEYYLLPSTYTYYHETMTFSFLYFPECCSLISIGQRSRCWREGFSKNINATILFLEVLVVLFVHVCALLMCFAS